MSDTFFKYGHAHRILRLGIESSGEFDAVGRSQLAKRQGEFRGGFLDVDLRAQSSKVAEGDELNRRSMSGGCGFANPVEAFFGGIAAAFGLG